MIAPSESGAALLGRARPSSAYRGEVADRIADEFARTVHLTDDTSLGRYPDLTDIEWQRESARWERAFWDSARPYLALAGLLRRYVRWRHPEDYPD